MNELEITQCLSEHPLTKAHFKGVFARDELKRVGEIKKAKTFIIVNSDLRGNEGEHWLLLFWFDEATPPLYFDSYGLPAMFPEFERRLLKKHKTYNYNAQRLQGDVSNVCAHYCIYFASQICNGSTLEQTRAKFSTTNFAFNDKLVVVLFRNIFGLPCVSYKKPKREAMTCQCLDGDRQVYI